MSKQFLLGMLLSVGAIALLIYIVDWQAAWQSLQGLDYIYLLPSALFITLPFLFRWLRWRLLLAPLGNIPGLPVFSAMSIGFMANNILPAHLGEFVRAYLLGRSQQASKSAILATIVMERIFDGMAVLLLLLLVMISLEPSHIQVAGLSLAVIKTAGWLGAALFAALMALMQLLRYRWQTTVPFILRLTGFLSPSRQGKLLLLLQSFARGLAVGKKQLLGICVYSLLTWVSFSLGAYFLFPAFKLELGIQAALLLQCIITLSMLIPSAPAYVGTFHLAAVFTLSYLGANTGVAGSYSMLLWLISIICSSLPGIIMLGREGLNLKEVAGAGNTPRPSNCEDYSDRI